MGKVKNPFIEPQLKKGEDRSSISVQLGSQRGVGKRQPVGHEGNPRDFTPDLSFLKQNDLSSHTPESLETI